MKRRRRKKITREPQCATIEKLIHDGRGLAHLNHKATFITGALAHEQVEFVYTDQRGNYDEGKATKILVSSPQRVSAKCAHFNMCGGCSLQHLNHPQQLALKQQTLLEQLQHFGGIIPKTLLPPLTGPIWGYRRKARLGVRYVSKKQSVLVGFREKQSSFIAELESCEVLHPMVAKLIMPLRQLVGELKALQHIPQIEVAVDDHHVALVFRHLKPLVADDLALLKQFAKQHSIYLYLQPKGLDSVHLVYPKDVNPLLCYHFHKDDLDFYFMPTDFSQVNLTMNQQMIQQALQLLELQPKDQLLDLFCGFGNFTLPLARRCQEVTGVEGSMTAIERAKLNASHNQISNVRFYCDDLTKDFTQATWWQQKYDKILIDPPRSGAAMIVEQIGKLHAQYILYVSCNPATLARDAALLVKQGYRLLTAGIMDMFPHTTHVESIALFEKM